MQEAGVKVDQQQMEGVGATCNQQQAPTAARQGTGWGTCGGEDRKKCTACAMAL
jgi:hypothetical protein